MTPLHVCLQESERLSRRTSVTAVSALPHGEAVWPNNLPDVCLCCVEAAGEMSSLMSLQEENRVLQGELARLEDLLAHSRADRDELAIKYGAISERVRQNRRPKLIKKAQYH